METFNEVITLNTLYLMMCFSDFIPDPVIRAQCGKVYIALIILYALVHFYFLFADVFSKILRSIRKLYYKKRNQKLLAKMKKFDGKYNDSGQDENDKKANE